MPKVRKRVFTVRDDMRIANLRSANGVGADGRMTHEYTTLTPLREATAENLNRFVAELNLRLQDLSEAISTLEGRDGRKAQLLGDLDVNRKTLKNVEQIILTVKPKTAPTPVRLQPIASPAATASVTALRDDLVANTLPSIRDALGELERAINTLVVIAKRLVA